MFNVIFVGDKCHFFPQWGHLTSLPDAICKDFCLRHKMEKKKEMRNLNKQKIYKIASCKQAVV